MGATAHPAPHVRGERCSLGRVRVLHGARNPLIAPAGTTARAFNRCERLSLLGYNLTRHKRNNHHTHSVSPHHLHRYVSEFEFRYNTRKLSDGERIAEAFRGAEGKRLLYRQPAEA